MARAALRAPADAGGCHEVISPVTGEVIERVPLMTSAEIAADVSNHFRHDEQFTRHDVLAFLRRLRDNLASQQDRVIRMTMLETGFIDADSRDIVNAAIEFLDDFELYVDDHATRPRSVRHSYGQGPRREMRIAHRPYRCIAAMVPQNASFTLAITILASALYAGSRVVLRPSLQCGASGALLADLVRASEPPAASVLVVNCMATDFVEMCYETETVELIHYIGSNRHALSVLVGAFEAKKACLLDGQGNGVLYVDDSYPLEESVRLITSGATRYNGETCTSVNGVLVAPSLYPRLRDALVESFRALKVGSPEAGDVEVGPLFSSEQAENLGASLRGEVNQRVLCGGTSSGAYFAPAVVTGVTQRSSLVREGLFGPAIWIHSVEDGEVIAWLRANEFPLSDTVLSTRSDMIRRFVTHSRAARITLNEDPSVESMFEPWGGYPPSGLNPVSIWIEKYRQPFQLDGRPRDVRAADRSLEIGDSSCAA